MNALLRLGFTLIAVLLATSAYAAATPWYDIKVVDGKLMLPTEVDGIPGQSIIDTGSEFTAINTQFLEAENLDLKTGRKVLVPGVYGEEKRVSYRNVPGTVFGSEVNFSRVVGLELGDSDVQMLLGAGFFQDYIFQFDYTNERMRLITRDSIDMKSIKNVDSKKDKDNDTVVVKVLLDNGDAAWMLMDTGSASGLMVERSLAQIFDWTGTYPTIDGDKTGVNANEDMEYFRIPALEVGPFRLENVLVSMPEEGKDLEFFDKESETGTRFAKRNMAQGLLGNDILKHFVVTIDYQRGYVHFYPGEKIAESVAEN